MELRTVDGKYETRSYISNPNQQWGSTAPLANGQVGGSASGMAINSHSALTIAAMWGSASLIADSIATLPVNQWVMGKDGMPKAIDSAPIIQQPWAPWPEFTMLDFLTQGSMSFLTAGNTFGNILGFDEMALPTQVELIDPNKVDVRRNVGSKAIEVRYGNTLMPDDLVTRKMALSLPGDIVGLNPVRYMRNTLGRALAQDLASGAFFANSARPDGVITLPGDFDPNEVQSFKESWLEGHQGIAHSYMLGVLTGGATYTPVSVSMADAQFIEQMQFSVSQIAGLIYRVPPHMLGQVEKSTSWGNGIEQQELGFVRNTLGIYLERWEDWMSGWLPKRQFVTFDLSKRLRGDTLQRYNAHQIARIAGFKSNLDIIREEGQTLPTDPAVLEQLARYDQPLNSAPMKEAQVAQGGDGAD